MRAGVVAALAGGLLTAVPSPAQAAPNLQIDGIGNVELRVGGGNQPITIRIRNQAGAAEENLATDVRFSLTVPLTQFGVGIANPPAGATCNVAGGQMDCAVGNIPGGGEWTGVMQLGAPAESSLDPGDTENGTAQVTVTSPVSAQRDFGITLRGPDRASSVKEVSGVVHDSLTGQPIAGATVSMQDQSGQTRSVGTNDQGEFRFTSSGDQPITPGVIALAATKDGYETSQPFVVDGQAGQAVIGQRLALVALASPSPSAGPSPTAAATPTAEATPTEVGAAVPPPDPGGGAFSTVMIILGLLLLALGIGGVAYLIWRRRRGEGEDGIDGADDPTSGPRGPTPTPGSRGVYRPTPTQVAGQGAATTVVARPGGPPLPAVGPRPALADAPTMLHRGAGPAADETALLARQPDPYGVRPAQPPYATPGSPAGYAPGAPGGYAAGSPGGYAAGSPGGYAAGSPGGYGGPAAPGSPAAGGYPAGPGHPSHRSGHDSYDEPTGRFQRGGGYGQAGAYEPPADPDSYRRPPEGHPPGPYEQPAGGYAESPAYGQAGYDRADSGQPGYDRAGYDRAGYDQAGYDQAGYERAGYDQAGYERGGYGQPGYPPADPRGYGQPEPRRIPEQRSYPPPSEDDYYDEYGAPRSRHSAPPDRRLDWLDD